MYLQKCIKSGKIFHAYIFAGSEGLGKTTVARLFFQTLACKLFNPTIASFPCNTCKVCQQMQSGSHPDLYWLAPVHSPFLLLDDIQSLRSRLSKRAFFSGITFVGIEKAHLLTPEASSALLKLIEEPVTRLCCIFLTSAYAALPETLRSRTHVIFFHPVSQSLISDSLRDRCSHKQALELAQESFGRPGFALQALATPELRKNLHTLVAHFLKVLHTKKLAARLTMLEALFFRGISTQHTRARFQEICEVWSFVLRDIFFVKLDQKKYLRFPTFVEQYNNFAAQITSRHLLQMMQDTIRITQAMKTNITPQLLLEQFFLQHSFS
ncbi:MAG: hypothetical protein A3B74_03865 [Candidatus Kerfeldbacteria bacterium RIFCSPHIGHO2_02_FULL_42_14]|uniref:DNA polymerase III subunit delta n=1 Tax=Candidatus Kerfeldbacteria bacterium RIFCSPHIGHO2_02_FULL_42_14 TaxID=1798540 RepID=A0A1G2AR63_9BACT|nr:MAG: hypothetical protein A3B74_03865 [Candidatus Kerfeldbacteria bacterium RIFCSPHIGHO2_02_FULL_42_14]OGY80650.1 MAG: hypothetical protein A3E60_04365 [Candidatus Kerfeldbacteria bacterium RIFCSPHIGHO2_12_FULL_42_13]OGY82574.1 MAG: hypothetical protein A3I91_04025 [Candidatus Kerfeldbacteria bacterium RIFCSPLOWO2_02_FULL_42_19]OGY85178.1 MAG: hypothetical protein A3G01_01155 [Candidatus Kerfeldbacteria bacterium RIFCSPLOWO2_12_FULL_43_9]